MAAECGRGKRSLWKGGKRERRTVKWRRELGDSEERMDGERGLLWVELRGGEVRKGSAEYL